MKKMILDYDDIKQKEKYENELKIFKKLNHPNLIKYVDSFIHKEKLCIVMEYAKKGDLTKVIDEYKSKNQNIPEEIIWRYFIQICKALNYMHSHKILHRDIKCKNIFLSSNDVIKVGDFGISRILKNTQELCSTQLGTPFFLSPEICNHQPYSYKSDVWMLGCALYELLTFSKPFSAKSLPELVINITNNQINFDIIPNIYSDELKNLVKRLLEKDTLKRPYIKQVLEYDYIKEKNKNLFCTYNNKEICNYETNHEIEDNDEIIYQDEDEDEDCAEGEGEALHNDNNDSVNNSSITNSTCISVSKPNATESVINLQNNEQRTIYIQNTNRLYEDYKENLIKNQSPKMFYNRPIISQGYFYQGQFEDQKNKLQTENINVNMSNMTNIGININDNQAGYDISHKKNVRASSFNNEGINQIITNISSPVSDVRNFYNRHHDSNQQSNIYYKKNSFANYSNEENSSHYNNSPNSINIKHGRYVSSISSKNIDSNRGSNNQSKTINNESTNSNKFNMKINILNYKKKECIKSNSLLNGSNNYNGYKMFNHMKGSPKKEIVINITDEDDEIFKKNKK